MSKELQLVATCKFNGVAFNCYVDPKREAPSDFWATREQIGSALGYEDPTKAIGNLHERNKDRLDKFSTTLNLRKVEGGCTVTRKVMIYTFKGLLEICRHSSQPTAEAVIDVLWDIAGEIRRTGSYSIKNGVEAPSQFQIDQLNLERVRFLQHMIDAPAFPLTDESKAVIQHAAFKMLTGHECLAMLPALTEQWYTAGDIGRELGITGCKVGHIANKHGLKPPKGESNKYGRWTVSKSRYSSKECPQFIYSQCAFDWFISYRDGTLLDA